MMHELREYMKIIEGDRVKEEEVYEHLWWGLCKLKMHDEEDYYKMMLKVHSVVYGMHFDEKLAKKAVAMFPDADVEIVEAHHNRKADAPSGTAKMIASAIKEVRPEAEFVYGRNGMKKREKNEIGIHALRMGNESGMHEIYVSTDSQTLTLRHNAESHQVFADGALAAAKYVATKKAGFYNMDTMLADVK